MSSLPVGIRNEYLLDGGGSSAISAALQPVAAEIRSLLNASVGLVAYRPRRAGAGLLVLAIDAPGAADPLLPNETIRTRLPVTVWRPSVVRHLQLSSTLRPHRTLLSSAVVVPWTDRRGDGVVLVGNTGISPTLSEPAADTVRRLITNVRRTVATGRRHGAAQINGDLQRAMKDIAAAAVTSENVAEALTSMLLTARALFGSEVAYLSLPDPDTETFTFDQMLGIHTPDFRHLRIREGQGLGGLARSLRRPVRSLNYARDSQLYAAPVAETEAEGIVSAMASPILVDEQVQAVLYVGDRTLHPFTRTDEEMLGELANYASLGMKRRATETYRRDVLRRQEQERLAYDLHDTAVRGLLEIGFAAEYGRSTSAATDVQTCLASIAAAAERCMEAVRGQLDLLLAGTSGRTAQAVLDEIAKASFASDVEHRFAVRGPRAVLPDPVADALIRIGQEALVNVDRHAAGSPATVDLEVAEDAWVLTVTNAVGDGQDVGSPNSGHLGLQAMQRAADRVHGQVERTAPPGGGFVVRAAVPMVAGQ